MYEFQTAAQISEIFWDHGAGLTGDPVYDPETGAHLVSVLVKTGKKGNQIPSDRAIAKAKSVAEHAHGKIRVSLVHPQNAKFEQLIRETLLEKFSNEIKDVFCIFEPRGVQILADSETNSYKSSQNDILEVVENLTSTFDLRLISFEILSGSNSPPDIWFMNIIRKKAPISVDEIKKEIHKKGFESPEDKSIMKTLDRWRKRNFIHRRHDGKYVLTISGLQVLGSFKDRLSPDVVRALDMSGNIESRNRFLHPSTSCLCFLAENSQELIELMGDYANEGESELIRFYFENNIPPVTSHQAISAMFGYNKGFIWSLLHNTERHYRIFHIPKGKSRRKITAPRVALKTIQKWLSVHFQEKWNTHDAAHGFVPGRSHLAAAAKHLSDTDLLGNEDLLKNKWVISVDIEDFFPSVSVEKVKGALRKLGYKGKNEMDIISSLICYKGGLAQGSPASPVISNIVLHDLDVKLADFANDKGFVYTRYADDIVVSGTSGSPDMVLKKICRFVTEDGWQISDRKTTVHQYPKRLKVHGLLVHRDRIKLTKGYRNRVRAYKHLFERGKIKNSDLDRVSGHLRYAKSVEKFHDVDHNE